MMDVLLQLALMIIRFIYFKQPKVVVDPPHHQLLLASSQQLIYLDVLFVQTLRTVMSVHLGTIFIQIINAMVVLEHWMGVQHVVHRPYVLPAYQAITLTLIHVLSATQL